MENLREFIEKKKEKSASRKPRYGTRKLSVGLVSCVLGYFIFLSPTVVSAQVGEGVSEPTSSTPIEASANTSGGNTDVAESSKPAANEENQDSVEATNVENKETEKETEAVGGLEVAEAEVKEAVAEAPVVEAEKEAPAAEEALAVDEKEATPVEEEVTETETKEEAQAEEEKESDDKLVEDKEDADKTIEEDKKESLENKETEETEEAKIEEEIEEVDPLKEELESERELLLNEEVEPEALQAGETAEEKREAKDISNEVQSKYVALTEEGHKTKGTVKPDAGEAIGWEVFFTSPKGTIAGDYFTIDLSDNLSLKGIEPDHENEYPIEINGKVVADGVRVDRSTIKYTFNENINDERNVVVSVKGFAYIDKTKVPNNKKDEKISIALGDKVDEHTINVQYGDPYYTGDKLNGMSQFTEFDPKTGEYTQVFYINPDSKTITTSTRNWATGKVVAFIDGITPDGSKSDVNYTDKDTTVTVQKLPAGTKVPDAIIENPVETDEPTMVKTTFRDGGIEIVFADNSDDNLRSNNIDSPYIITVKSIAAPSKTGNNVYSRATFYGDGSKFHIMDNSIVTTKGDTEAQGDKIGYFIEHHVYKTKVDGVLQEDKTFTLDSNKMEGYDYNKYFTNKNVIDDFKFVKVDTDKLVENPVYNTDGTIARGNYEPGKTKEVTYIYERDIKHGSFQEHHIYQTLDEDGNIIDEKTVTKDGTETTGIDENEYSTSKKDQAGNVVTEEKDKDGYKLVEVKATNDKSKELGVQFDGQGVATSGNYVNGEKLEVTYIYQKEEQKPVEKTHALGDKVWLDDNKDGLQTEGEKGVKGVTVKLTGGDLTEEKTTTTDENGNYKFEGLKNGKYKVKFEIPEEYEVTKTNQGEDDAVDSDGTEVTVKIKDADNMTVDLGLVKKETPAPVEPSEPSEPEEPKDTTPLVPLTPAEEVEVERISHHDHKTPGTPVVTEVPSTPVVETEKSVEEKTEKTEETKEVENKEEKAEEVKEAEEVKTVEDDNLEKPQAPENHDKLAPRAPEKDKAPKTGDAGILSSLGLGSLAASGLAFIELKKRNKKNK